MIHPTIGWRRDEHGTHKHAHGSWILWSVSGVRSKTMHSLFCITSWLPYITLCYIDSRFFLPLEQSRTALLGCRLAASRLREAARWQRPVYNAAANPTKNCLLWTKVTRIPVIRTFQCFMDLFEKLMRNKLAIVDTTAAPAMYIVLLVVKLFEIYRFIMKIFTHIPYGRWDKHRKRKAPCTVSVRFTQLWSKQSQFRE